MPSSRRRRTSSATATRRRALPVDVVAVREVPGDRREPEGVGRLERSRRAQLRAAAHDTVPSPSGRFRRRAGGRSRTCARRASSLHKPARRPLGDRERACTTRRPSSRTPGRRRADRPPARAPGSGIQALATPLPGRASTRAGAAAATHGRPDDPARHLQGDRHGAGLAEGDVTEPGLQDGDHLHDRTRRTAPGSRRRSRTTPTRGRSAGTYTVHGDEVTIVMTRLRVRTARATSRRPRPSSGATSTGS